MRNCGAVLLISGVCLGETGGFTGFTETCGSDSSTLVQLAPIPVPSALSSLNDWASSRDLAKIPQLHSLDIADQKISIFSAVPVFGTESYIALLTEKDGDIWQITNPESHWGKPLADLQKSHQLFCTGPDRSHVSEVQLHGSVLVCPWPAEERQQKSFEVFLEDADGNILGDILASHEPTLLQQYQSLVCVRDAFWDPSPAHEWQGRFSGVFKQMVEWMEWSLMHGLDHFLVYTFEGTDLAEKEILEVYLDAAVASRVHFNFDPQESLTRYGYIANDCLWRAKNHARWVLTTVDVDEYVVNPQFVAGTYFDFDHMLKVSSETSREDVASLALKRIRFARPDPNDLEIASLQREPGVPERHVIGSQVKHVINPELVYRVSIHKLTVAKGETIDVMPEVCLIHHYRIPYDLKEEYLDADLSHDEAANVTDDSLLSDVRPLTEAIQKRFGLGTPQDVSTFLKNLVSKRPPATESSSS